MPMIFFCLIVVEQQNHWKPKKKIHITNTFKMRQLQIRRQHREPRHFIQKISEVQSRRQSEYRGDDG